jgi:hypothetical protein
LDGVVVDAALNNGGPAANGIQLGAPATQFSLILTGAVIQKWTTGEAIIDGASNVNVTLINTDITSTAATSCSGGVVLDSSVGGSLTVSGGTTTIAQLKSGGAYGMAYLATVAGQSVSITNHTVAAVAEPAATGSMYALYVEGVANALVSGGSYSLDTAGGTESGQCVGISRNASNALPINGGVISGVTAFINSPAGLGVFINLDTGGLNPALAIGLTLANNTVTAGAAFAAGGGHMTNIGSIFCLPPPTAQMRAPSARATRVASSPVARCLRRRSRPPRR